VIGPFNGDLTEGFESFPGPFQSAPFSIMGGSTTLSVSPNNHPFIYHVDPGGLFTFPCQLGSSTANAFQSSAQPASGSQGLGIFNSSGGTIVSITFGQPCNDFGGNFGTYTFAGPEQCSVIFFDGSNQQIGLAQSFSYDHSSSGDGVLDWHGWSSTVPFLSVQIFLGSNLSAFAALDDLQANLATVPEPESSAILVGCILVVFAGWHYRNHSLAQRR
jgi:hypothetical protein